MYSVYENIILWHVQFIYIIILACTVHVPYHFDT